MGHRALDVALHYYVPRILTLQDTHSERVRHATGQRRVLHGRRIGSYSHGRSKVLVRTSDPTRVDNITGS